MADRYPLIVVCLRPWLATKAVKCSKPSSVTGRGVVPDCIQNDRYFFLPARYVLCIAGAKTACSNL